MSTIYDPTDPLGKMFFHILASAAVNRRPGVDTSKALAGTCVLARSFRVERVRESNLHCQLGNRIDPRVRQMNAAVAASAWPRAGHL